MLAVGVILVALNIYGIAIGALYAPVSYALIIGATFTMALVIGIEVFKKKVLVDGWQKTSFILFGLLILLSMYFMISALSLLVYLNELQHNKTKRNHGLTALLAGFDELEVTQVESLNLPYYFITCMFVFFYIRCYYVMFWKDNIVFIFKYLKKRVNFLNRALLSNLPVLEMTAEMVNTSCCLCLEGYYQGEDITRLKCKHVFHLDCVRVWVMRSNTCPLCRKKAIFY